MGEPKSSPIFPLRLCNAVNIKPVAEHFADIRDVSLYDQSVSDGGAAYNVQLLIGFNIAQDTGKFQSVVTRNEGDVITGAVDSAQLARQLDVEAEDYEKPAEQYENSGELYRLPGWLC